MYTVSQNRFACFWLLLCQTLTNFQNSFTARKRMKFATGNI